MGGDGKAGMKYGGKKERLGWKEPRGLKNNGSTYRQKCDIWDYGRVAYGREYGLLV